MKFTSRWLFPVAALAVAACSDNTTTLNGPEAADRRSSNIIAGTTNTFVVRPSMLGTTNVSGSADDGAPSFGPGSVAGNATTAGAKSEMNLSPEVLFGRAITMGQIKQISYWTKTGATHAVDPRDWFLAIYTKPFTGDVSTPTWYGGRYGTEPYFSANIADPANTWNQWSTDGAANTLRFFESTAGAPGATFGSYTDPTWDTFTSGNSLGTSVSRASQEVFYFSISTGSAWANGFTGKVDGLRMELTDGTVALVNIEPNGPACTTACFVSTTGNDANGGASAGDAKKTIGAAITAVTAGGTVTVAAGNYSENVTIPKQLTLEGAGSANTIVTSAIATTPVITITGSGADVANRLIVRNLAVTGATGLDNPGAGVLVVGAAAAEFLTFSDVSATNNQGPGIAFNNTVGVKDVVVTNATLSNNGQGIRIASAVPSFNGLAVSGTTIANNASIGFNYNPNGTLTNVGTNFSFTNTTFSNNSQAGVSNANDLSFSKFNGTASLTDVTVISSNGPSTTHKAYGIAFTGTGTGATISLDGVTISGTVGKGAIVMQTYNDVTGISMTDVDVTATTAPWGQIIAAHTGAANLNLGNTALKTLVMWQAGGADARNASFYDVTPPGALLNQCAVGPQIGDKVDNSALGLVLLTCAPVGSPVQAPTGADAEVSFADANGAPVADITFANVATTGAITIAPIAPTSYTTENPAPAGFALGDSPVYYDIDFSGTFTGSIEVCLVYPDGAFTGTEPALFHYEGDPKAWKNVTTSVNTATRTVCGEVTSFSPFALGIDLSTENFTVNGGNPVQVNTAAPIAGTVPTGFSVEYNIEGGSFTQASTITFSATGVYTVCVRLTNGTATGSSTCVEVPVYDPTAGFVTGGGWFMSPATAFKAAESLTGKANFGFVSKYEKGATVPTGNTSFQFSAGKLSFSSTSYEWLVVNRNDTNAQYKGVGTVTINGVATTGAGFMLWAQDGKSGNPDTFRIMITAPNGGLIYDNLVSGEFGTRLGGGNIIVHTK